MPRVFFHPLAVSIMPVSVSMLSILSSLEVAEFESLPAQNRVRGIAVMQHPSHVHTYLTVVEVWRDDEDRWLVSSRDNHLNAIR